MAARGKSKAAKADPVEIVAIKGFDSDFACAPIGGKRVQYKIGETFEAKGKIVACHNGLHSVECPFDVFNYYPASTSRYALVRASGEIARHDGDSKIASAKLYVEAELKLPDIIRRGVEWLIAHAKTTVATGDSGHAAATGDRGHAAATGDSGHAAATGYSGHAAATGDRGHAAATGDSGHAAATGEHAIAASLGPSGTAKAGKGGWIVLAHWNTDSWPHTLTRVERFKVGSNGVEAGKTYRLTADGKPEEVR
jgi:hypothetical protein